ncbi:BamA/TamA family outer membrane protein [candidate division WOR-3 bacterium]|nr:BamA/TamA family outer membrane protein [candidate division WOR-3 bacterium]
MVGFFVSLILINLSISEIEFVGNESMPARTLRSEITSKTGEEYRELDLNYDAGRIAQAYRREGFFYTEVMPEARTSDTLVTVVFRVEEGLRPKIRQILVNGDRIEEVKDHFHIGVGDYFIQENVNVTAKEIEDDYKDHGYPFAEVTASAEPDSGFLVFDIEKGFVHYIRSIEVRGLKGTRPRVVYREIELKPGDRYSKSKVYNSQRRIYALGFFSMLKVEMLRQQPDSIDLVFDLRELKSRRLNFGVGVTLPFSFLFSLGLEELNLANIGHRANISPFFKFNIQKEWEIKLEGLYSLPYVTPLGLKLSLLPFYWIEDNLDFSRWTRGNEFRITKVFSEEVAFSIAHQYKYVDIQPKITLPDTFKGVTNGVILRFLVDRRDEFFHPRQGFYVVPLLEYAGGIFGGANNFMRIEVEQRSFHPLFNNTFAQRFKFGVMIPTDGLGTYEKYYIGGQYTLRGYPEKSVGPDSIASLRYGNILLNLNFEYRVVLPMNFGLVGFFDVGYVDNKIDFRDTEYLKMSAGVGLRYSTPIGPARLDLGFPLVDKGRELYFGIYHIF